MRATIWAGRNSVEVQSVPDPKILNDRDAIVRITSTAICGSDLHLYDGYIPTVKRGRRARPRVHGRGRRGRERPCRTSPSAIGWSCRSRSRAGACSACKRELFSLCENSNPNAGIAEKFMGHSPAGLFGYSHMLGGFAGGQAEYARVPFADVGPLKIEDDLTDEQVLFLSDILPTGYMGAEMCDIKPGDVVAVWGAGPVGLFAMTSAYLLGASKVVAIDRVPYRLEMAAEGRRHTGRTSKRRRCSSSSQEMTAGRGPDHCIDAVGMEARNGAALVDAYDRAKQAHAPGNRTAHALREAAMSCRNGGTISIIGVYGGLMDKFPIGAVMNRSLTVKTGQCHVQRYMRPLLDRIRSGDIDPTIIVSHHLSLDQAAHGYEIFKHKQDHCTKVILNP